MSDEKKKGLPMHYDNQAWDYVASKLENHLVDVKDVLDCMLTFSNRLKTYDQHLAEIKKELEELEFPKEVIDYLTEVRFGDSVEFDMWIFSRSQNYKNYTEEKLNEKLNEKVAKLEEQYGKLVEYEKYKDTLDWLVQLNLEPQLVMQALALGLHYYDEISFGKAAEVHGFGRPDFHDFLAEHGLPGMKLSYGLTDIQSLNILDGKDPNDGLTEEDIKKWEYLELPLYEKWKLWKKAYFAAEDTESDSKFALKLNESRKKFIDEEEHEWVKVQKEISKYMIQNNIPVEDIYELLDLIRKNRESEKGDDIRAERNKENSDE